MHEQGGRRWIRTVFLSTYSGVGSRSYVGWLMNWSIPLCGDHSLSTLMAAVSLYIRTGTSKQRLWRLQSRQVLCPTKLEMHSEIENTYYIHIYTYIYKHKHTETHLLLCVTLNTCWPFGLLWTTLLFLFCLKCLCCLWCLYPFYYCCIWCLFSLFIRVFYVWICLVLILPSWFPAASVSSAISFTGQQIKQ